MTRQYRDSIRFGKMKTAIPVSYVTTTEDPVAYVASACADDSFDRYLLKYPVSGPMPYRGFHGPVAISALGNEASKDRLEIKKKLTEAVARNLP